MTVCTRKDEVLPPELASPTYTATIVWLPVASVEIVSVATPSVRVPVPIGTSLQKIPKQSSKVTEPDGVPVVNEVTVALNVVA